MEKEFIPYEEALALKELGFDEDCFRLYNQNDLSIEPPLTPTTSKNSDRILYASKRITAPLYQQAFRWFREKYGLYSEIFVDDNKTFGFLITSFLEEGRLDKPITRQFDSYEEAELECTKQLILIIDMKGETYN